MYAIADLTGEMGWGPRQRGLYGRLYAVWFTMVESDWTHKTRFFARFMRTDGLDIVDIIARHKALASSSRSR
jgi:hypothetical protein